MDSTQQKVFSSVMDSPMKKWLNSHPKSEITSSYNKTSKEMKKLDDWEQWLFKKPSTVS